MQNIGISLLILLLSFLFASLALAREQRKNKELAEELQLINAKYETLKILHDELLKATRNEKNDTNF